MTGSDVLGTPDTPAVPPGVHARGVRRSYGPVHAVQGVDMDAPPGEVTALVGPNGAGKTTPELVRPRMGWSPDVFGLYDNLTAREYLEVMAAAYHIPARARADRARYLLQ